MIKMTKFKMDEKEFMQFKDWIPKIEEEGNDVWVYLYNSIKEKEDEPKNDLVIYSSCLNLFNETPPLFRYWPYQDIRQ